MNFIPVKVSTLRESQIVVVFISVPIVTKIKIVIVLYCIVFRLGRREKILNL
jgi:hypothetical protein